MMKIFSGSGIIGTNAGTKTVNSPNSSKPGVEFPCSGAGGGVMAMIFFAAFARDQKQDQASYQGTQDSCCRGQISLRAIDDRDQDDESVHAADHRNTGGIGQCQQEDAAGPPRNEGGDDLGLNDFSQSRFGSVPSLLQQGERPGRFGSPIRGNSRLGWVTSTIIRVLSIPTVRPYLFIILTRADSDGEAMRCAGPSSCWTRAASLSIPLPPPDRGTPARLRDARWIAERI